METCTKQINATVVLFDLLSKYTNIMGCVEGIIYIWSWKIGINGHDPKYGMVTHVIESVRSFDNFKTIVGQL